MKEDLLEKSRKETNKAMRKGNSMRKEFKGWSKTNTELLLKAREEIIKREKEQAKSEA